MFGKFFGGDTTVVNKDNFDFSAIKNFYMNYLNSFSNIEFTIIDAFGQGDKIVR